jgi:hypothetical protein
MTRQPIRLAGLNFAHGTVTCVLNDAVMRICAAVSKTGELGR